ncbi:MAG: hypothetical protein ACD_79C01073G0002 [uncultured bacterium]|nr:MAG: hypothetical protein ACD_79C01073G0002 [uncultured bacterium]
MPFILINVLIRIYHEGHEEHEVRRNINNVEKNNYILHDFIIDLKKQ